MRCLGFVIATLVLAPACLSSEEKGLEEEPPPDGKDDSFRKPIDHGAIVFGEPGFAALTETERFHAWTFELSGDAHVDMTTSYAIRGQRRTDTVLYLYKESANGWGSYIARNDDYGSTTYSQLIRDLGAGRYRVLVKGHQIATKGKFKVTVGCSGAGCIPASSCLFGSTYTDIATRSNLQIDNTNTITVATLNHLGAEDQQRLVVAVQQSSHTDVTTPVEALGRVDQGEVNVTWLSEPAGRRSFVAFEYGAGDNSYGAIFDHVSGAMVTKIHDGDLAGCNVEPEVCLLPEDYGALKQDPAFILQEDRVITSAAGLDLIAADQILIALRRVYGANLVSIEAGLALADDHQVNYRVYTHSPTNTDLHVVELGAGDTSVGTIYYLNSVQVAGIISDLFIDGCTLFAVRERASVGEACRGAGGCESGLRCEGVFAGAGVCVVIGDVPGEGLECNSDAGCGVGLVCAGATRGFGLCNPAWQRGTFADAATAAVPDASVLVRRLAVRGLATVDTDVVLRATIDHPRASQLRVTLTNPAGNEVVVRDGKPSDDGHPMTIDGPIIGFSGDEQVNGEWALRITDRTAGQTGTLAGGWGLTVTSRMD